MSAITRTIEDLRPCPCGETPEALTLVEGSSCKWAFVSGNCCNEWLIEFRTDYCNLDASEPEIEERMIAAWNNAPRKEEENESTG